EILTCSPDSEPCLCGVPWHDSLAAPQAFNRLGRCDGIGIVLAKGCPAGVEYVLVELESSGVAALRCDCPGELLCGGQGVRVIGAQDPVAGIKGLPVGLLGFGPAALAGRGPG